eukprot:74329-Pelagomonas_calceolata.AAC.4
MGEPCSWSRAHCQHLGIGATTEATAALPPPPRPSAVGLPSTQGLAASVTSPAEGTQPTSLGQKLRGQNSNCFNMLVQPGPAPASTFSSSKQSIA